MQENQRRGRSAAKHCKVGPLLWEIICSTLLTNPAEQSVVQHIVGKTLILESSFLHREALALQEIFSAFTSAHEPQNNHGEKNPNPTVPAQPSSHPRHSLYRNDGFQANSANSSQKTQTYPKEHIQSRANVGGLTKSKSDSVGADVACSSNKEMKDMKARNPDANGDSVRKALKQEDASRPLRQSSVSSSPSSSQSVKRQDGIKNSSTSAGVIAKNADTCAGFIPQLDFSAFLNENGAKINAYDIDDVVHELRDTFAEERVYLNELVERLRRALYECIDSYSMADSKPNVNSFTGIKDRSRVVNGLETSKGDDHAAIGVKTWKSDLPPPVIRPSKYTGQVAQRPPSPFSSRPSLVPIVKSIKERHASKATSVASSKFATIKALERPSPKNVVTSNNPPNVHVRKETRYSSSLSS